MRILRILRDRLRALWHAEQVHDDIADEFRFHVEMRARENERRGMSAADARRDAERRFGSAARIHDIAYDVRGGGWVATLWQDIRYGARVLAAQKIFSATVILTVGIGVGANAMIFTLVDLGNMQWIVTRGGVIGPNPMYINVLYLKGGAP
jgi:hypothetical protein